MTALNEFRPQGRTWVFANGIVTRRKAGVRSLLARMHKLGAATFASLANAVIGRIDNGEFSDLLESYLYWNRKEASQLGGSNYRLRAIYEQKATSLAMAVMRTATANNLRLLRESFDAVTLTPSAQYCALALIRVGGSGDIIRVIRRVEQADDEIQYWFQIEMGRIVEDRMANVSDALPIALLQICEKKGFWDVRNKRSRFLRRDLLPLRNPNNRALYLRLVAHAAIGAARINDVEMLKRLAQHDYRMIARAAAVRLVRLEGDVGMKVIQSGVSEAIENANGEAFGLAVRDAEIRHYGLVSSKRPGENSLPSGTELGQVN